MLGIGGAGYLLLKGKQTADAKQPAPNAQGEVVVGGKVVAVTNLSVLHDAALKGLVVHTTVAEGGFRIGGPLAKAAGNNASTSVGATLATITGTVGAGLGIVAAVGGGSVAAGLHAIAAGASAAGPMAIAIGAIVGFVIIMSIGIGREVSNLNHGRDGYMDDLSKLAGAAHDAVSQVLTGTTPTNVDAIARCFAYATVRGYNRAAIAFADHQRDQFSPRSNEQNVGYWADRAMCIPEEGFISAIPPIQRQIYDAAGIPYSINSLELQLFAADTYEATKARLGGLFDKTAEDCADFVGRAVRCKHMADSNLVNMDLASVNINIDGPIQYARIYATMGCVGYRDGAPDTELQNHRPSAHDYSNVLDAQQGTIKDLDGNSKLVYCYNESAIAGTAVIR